MTDEENRKKADLFSDSDVKPLFGAEESYPQGKPLFDQDFSTPGDAAFVKPLFEETVPSVPEEFNAFGSEAEASSEEMESVQDEVIQEEISAEQQVVTEPATEPEPVFTEPLVPETPPFSEEVFAEKQPQKPSYSVPKENVRLDGDLESMSLGALMAYARKTVGYSFEDVYAGTKINERYLTAIEQNRFDQLPMGAFPGAYVRALCSFYHLESSAKDIAQKKASEYCTSTTPPDQVYNQINQNAIINKEEQEKFRRLIMVAGVILFSLILSIITIITIVTVKHKQGASAPVKSSVTMEKLEKLDPEPPQVITTELDVPK